MKDFSAHIEEVRKNTDIVKVIAQHFTLKRRGNNYHALCPFHHEETPSFVVSKEKQIFHCFGCGAGGDAFTFLMRHKNLHFSEALKQLGEFAGIQQDEKRS